MKRLIVIGSVVMLLLALAGCGEKTEPSAEASPAPVAYVEETSTLVPTGSPEPAETPKLDERTEAMYIEVNGQRFELILEENETAEAFRELLPAVWDVEELNGNEKFIYLDESLPSASEAVGHIDAGDLMLYGNSCVVLFYESFSTPYSYTRIGHLDDPNGLAEAVGSGDVTVSFLMGE